MQIWRKEEIQWRLWRITKQQSIITYQHRMEETEERQREPKGKHNEQQKTQHTNIEIAWGLVRRVLVAASDGSQLHEGRGPRMNERNSKNMGRKRVTAT